MAASKSTASQLIAVLLLCSQVTPVVSTEGRLFFLAFMNPTPTVNPNNGIQEIHISGSENADTKVRIELVSLNKTYMYMLNSTNQWRRTITIYNDLAGPSGTKLPVSAIISSEQNISVQANKAEDGTSGGYLALPITVESTQYYVASYKSRGNGVAFSIAAPYHTCVTIYKQNGPQQTRELDVSLDPGQVYHYTAAADLTGYYIESMKPIAVFSGLDCAYVPHDASPQICDHIVEQLHPKSEFATVFIMFSIPGRKPNTGFQIRVMGTIRTDVTWAEMDYDPTTNTVGAPVVNGPTPVLRGQYLELTAGRGKSKPVAVMLSCSQPCEVMQYGESNDMTPTGSEPSGVKPDSTMITVPGLQHYTNDITFSTSKLYSASGNQTLENVNGITVVAKKSQLNMILLDGQPLTSALSNAEVLDVTFPQALRTSQSLVPTETYAIVYGSPLNPGFHRVTTSDKSVLYMVYVYGHAPSSSPSDSEGYAYLGGMRYGQPTNLPIVEGPWFDFNQPVSEDPKITNPNPGPEQPNSPVTPTEYPSYESIWEARFYILHPHLEDLKTRNCSEAYYRYYLEERFYPKQKQVIQMAKDRCASTVTVNMTHMLYYSQFTDGLIRFRLSLTATGAVTMNDIMDCLGTIADDLSSIKNWVPVGYVDETSFLRPDAYYNRGCDRLHMKTPNFESFFYGWNCPTRGGLVGASKAPGFKASLGYLLGLTLGSILLLRR